MNTRNQLLCAHSVLLFMPMLATGLFFFPGWLPPPSPSLPVDQWMAMLSTSNTIMRVGMMITAVGGILYVGLPAAISVQMRRMEGPHHALSDVQLLSAVMGVPAILFPAYWWLSVTYRDGMSTDLVMAFNDLSWFTIIGMAGPGILQCIVIGLCILGDQTGKNIYPRWLGYLNLWVAFADTPGLLLPFFKSGPFAWNGLFGFWLVATAFFGWLVVMYVYTVKAIRRHAREGGAA